RHSLEHKHARHDRIFGEVSDEVRLVERDVFYFATEFIAADLGDPVDKQKGITVRQRGENFATGDGLKRLAGHDTPQEPSNVQWHTLQRWLAARVLACTAGRSPAIPQRNA